MSDEYEYEDDERKPRMTFGQIIASLLLLGVVVVIGLLVLLYFKLTEPVQRGNMVSTETSAPVRPVERFTPDGKPVSEDMQTAISASSAASEVAAQQKAADEAVQNLQNKTAGNAPISGLNGGAAVAGGAAAGATAAQIQARRAAAAQRRREREAAQGENAPRRRQQQQQQYTEADEIPLQPIQRGERRLTPRNNNVQQSERVLTPRNTRNNNSNQQGERTLTPRRSNQAVPADMPQRPIRINPPAEQRERPLTPTRPKSGKSGEFDDLF